MLLSYVDYDIARVYENTLLFITSIKMFIY